MPEFPPPSFDALTLAAVAQDVRRYLGAQFGGVRQVAPDTLILTLRPDGRDRAGPPAGHLLFSIHPERARIHFAMRPGAAERLAPFGQLLRSRLVEARLRAVEQPAFDRVLRLRFDGLGGPIELIAEIMGRHSNLILADTRVVLGALKVVTVQMSARRPVLPGRPYVAPPAERPGPDGLDEPTLREILAGDRPLWQRLSGAVRGLGPLLAREVAARAGIDPATRAGEAGPAAGRVLAAIRAIAEVARNAALEPTVYESEGRVIAFAAIPLRVYARLAGRRPRSMSEAIERYFQHLGAADPLEELRRGLASAVRAVLRQREQAIQSNREALAESKTAERFRTMGELLLAYGSRIRPGDTSITVPGPTAGDPEIAISLDPALTPAKNAQRLFRRYQKARATERALPTRMAQLDAEAGALREALVQIETAESPDDLWEIHADLAARGALRRASRSRPTHLLRGGRPTGPRRFRTADGATIVAGRSARENDHVTFRVAGPHDLWFHARGAAGAHVILKTLGGKQRAEESPEGDIVAAAQVAAFYSEGRRAGMVAVDYVPRRHVRKMRGAPPGAVVYTGERTVRVTPALPASPEGAAPRDGAAGTRRRS